MQAGRLRHRVTLQRRADTQSTSGEVVPGYEDILTVWASIEPLSGREMFAAQQVQSEVNTRIRIRWRPEIDSTVRVVNALTATRKGSDFYDVLSASEDAQSGRQHWTLFCVRRIAEGWRRGPEDA